MFNEKNLRNSLLSCYNNLVLPYILIALFAVLIFYYIVCFLIANGFAAPNRLPLLEKPTVPYKSVSFYSHPDNVLLEGWYLPDCSNNTIITMPGGKQNRSQSDIGLIDLCIALKEQGYSVFTFDRRQCGESESPRLGVKACLDRDFAGAIGFIRNKKGSEENIYLWGTSIGAVAALSCAAKVNGIKGIIADSCFVDIPSMVNRVLRKTFPAFVIFQPGSIFMGRKFFGMERDRPIDNVGRISCPILFINGTEDVAVPKEDTYRLYISSKNPASQIWIVNGAEHSKSYLANPELYVDKVVSFLKMSEEREK